MKVSLIRWYVLAISVSLFFCCAKKDSLVKTGYTPFQLQLTTDEATNVKLITAMIDQSGLHGKQRDAALAHYLKLAKVPVKNSPSLIAK
ncbi:MAG TPA: hypothetical protein VLC98_15105 [Phnomibacter sp.]|nr:hypothetical protein [Phnomibacter sp.]